MGRLSAEEYKRQRIQNIKSKANGKANQTLDFINNASYDFKKALTERVPVQSGRSREQDRCAERSRIAVSEKTTPEPSAMSRTFLPR